MNIAALTRPRDLSLRDRALFAAVLVAVPALVLYSRTLMPDVGFWDTAEFQAIGPVLGIAHPTGFPTYTLLAWLASVVLQPLGNEALRANLLSALLVAGGCATLAATVTYLGGRIVAGVGAGLGLALAEEAWSNALHADPHALHLFLVATLLLLLMVWAERERRGATADRWLVAAAALFGVALGNHALTILLAPGIGLFVLAVKPRALLRPKLIAACLVALTLTTVALYAYLPLRSAMNPPLDYANPQTWDGFRYLVFAEQFRGTFRPLPDLLEALRTIVTETWQQLGLLAVLAGVGIVFSILRRPALVLLLALWFGVNWWFALGYVNADIGRYYLAPLLAVAVLGGLGGAGLLEVARRLLATIAQGAQRPPAALTRVALVLVAALVLVVPPFAAVGTRLPHVDESADRGARQWLNEMAANLAPDAVVVSWWSFSTTLWYGQYVEGWRPDVTIIDDRTMLDQQLGDVDAVLTRYHGTRPLYLIRLAHDLPRVQAEWRLEPVPGIANGPVYRVLGPVGGPNL